MPQARRNKSNTPRLAPRVMVLARETTLLVLGAVAVYTLISLASYSPLDPGWSHTGDPNRISNLGGRFGAWFADVMLHGFGRTAYVLPVLGLIAGWRLYRQRRAQAGSLQRWLLVGGGFLATLVGGCGLESLHFTEWSLAVPYVAGGVLGDLTSGWLVGLFGFTGATIFLLTLFVCGVTWMTHLSWFRVMDLLGKWAFDFVGFMRSTLGGTAERVKAVQTRRTRKATVSRARQRMEAKTPPRIEPQIAASPKDSGRMDREKQTTLFADRAGALPALSLLDPIGAKQSGYSTEALETMSRLVEKKLADFNIDVRVEAVHPGPVITRFEIEPAPGIKASQIVSLARDIARALSVVSVRVVDNIPGKTVIGLEIPNETRETVRLVEGLSSRPYEEANTPLALVLGKDIGGEPVIADLCKMPHLLIAGTTGSGKSVCINALVLSMVYKSLPDEVRLIMVDPKMLELSVYEGIPHLLAPVVTDMQQAANALRWCIAEMERRYRLMAALGVRNIAGFNRKVKAAVDAKQPLADPLAENPEEPAPLMPLPYIVVVIDELADLMMVVGKKIEELVTRLAQRARAAGIHLIVATQRPSVDVITGLLKANIPTRIAFQVSSRADSRTILDQMGAEQLLGHGDMLYLPPGSGLPMRVHGSYVSDQEVHRVVEHLKTIGPPQYNDDVTEGVVEGAEASGFDADGGPGGEADPLYDKALRFVTETRRASISAVQRQLRVGYNRAARMIEAMEHAGAVGPLQSNGKRDVIAPPPPE